MIAHSPSTIDRARRGSPGRTEAFHDELVELLEAARASDLPRATRQLGVVLEGCTLCHQKYRL